jgi:hypothetical protein
VWGAGKISFGKAQAQAGSRDLLTVDMPQRFAFRERSPCSYSAPSGKQLAGLATVIKAMAPQ